MKLRSDGFVKNSRHAGFVIMRRTYRTLNDCGIQHNAEVGLFMRPSRLNSQDACTIRHCMVSGMLTPDPCGERNAPAINPHIILLISIFGVSTGAIFARLADAPALVIAAYRVGIATVLLLPAAYHYLYLKKVRWLL